MREALGDGTVSAACNSSAAYFDEMVHQRIGGYDEFRMYMRAAFNKTDVWLAALGPSTLGEVVVRRPFPDSIASTYSALVGATKASHASTRRSAGSTSTGCAMGEIEHSRALVGLQEMTS